MNLTIPFLPGPAASLSPFAPEALDSEQQEFRGAIRDFARQELKPHREEIESLKPGLVRRLLKTTAEMGITGVDVPEEFGGLGFDWKLAAVVPDDLCECHSASFLVSLGVLTGIALLPVKLYGSPVQQQRILPGVAEGELVGAYCLTEPGSGSDALSSSSVARRQPDGGFLLSGRKQFITNANFADYYIIFARVLEGAERADRKSLSAFIVPREVPGLTVGPEETKMGLKGSSTASLTFDQSPLGPEALLGRVGEGADIALVTLDVGRLKLGMMNLGLSRRCLEEALAYTVEREQFGTPVRGFGAIRRKLAWMGQRLLLLESTAWRVAGIMDERIAGREGREAAEAIGGLALETSIVKILGSETLWLASDHALQCLGGYGFCEEYPLAAVVRDTRVDRIYEGTNEINRQVILVSYLRALLEGRMDLRRMLREYPAKLGRPGPNKTLHALRRLTLVLMDAAVAHWGQDLGLEQQAGEDLADLLIQTYALECAALRVEQYWDRIKDPRLAGLLLRLAACQTGLDCLAPAHRLLAALPWDSGLRGRALGLLMAARPEEDVYELSDRVVGLMTRHGHWAI